MSDYIPNMREASSLALMRASDSLVLWKSDVIRGRRWLMRGRILILTGIGMWFLPSSFGKARLIAACVLMTLACATAFYDLLVIRPRRKRAHKAFLDHLRTPLYNGNDDEAATARRLLYSADSFDNR